jgi:predicted RNase H-like nuclease (RuvC/YqgF family)
MNTEIVAAILGSGALGAVGSGIMAVVRARTEAEKTDAHTLQVVHTVYDDTLETVMHRVDVLETRITSLEESNARLRRRINQLELYIIREGLPLPDEY